MRERVKTESLTEVRDAYNNIYTQSEYGDKEILYRKVYRRLAPVIGERVLDIACGAGQWLEFLQQRRHPVAGCELSEQALRRAQGRCPEGWFFHADGARLPLRDKDWTYVTCLGSLEHFLDPLLGARELCRVLTEDGRAVIMLPNSYYSGDIWRVMRHGYGPNHHRSLRHRRRVARPS